MGKKKRKFIDKRVDKVLSFKIVQRSQKDPLVADESAPQGVLVEAGNSKDDKEELLKYGIYFDDDYDYLQHLRGARDGIDWDNCEMEVYTIRKEDPKKDIGLVLPSSAFESYLEEPVGLLNKAAPVADLGSDVDSDIAAALNSDDEANMYDPEDEEAIPDNFISLLNADDDDDDDGDDDDQDIEEEEANVSSEIDESEVNGSVEHFGVQQWLRDTEYYDGDPSHSQKDYQNIPALEDSSDDEYYDAESEENGNYDGDFEAEEERDEIRSLPSIKREKEVANNSTNHRTELQKYFDAKFENLYEREYGEDQIDLDPDSGRGPIGEDHPLFLQAIELTKRQMAKLKLDSIEGEDKDRTIMWVKNNMALRNDMQGEKEEYVDIEVESKPKFDLQSFHKAQAKRQPVIRSKLIDLDSLLPNRKSRLTMKAVKAHNKAYRDEDDETSSDSESEDMAPTFKSQIKPKTGEKNK
ncbi:Protein LTV1-like protein [Armadillidium vulgare]|nr:Protein LTV1-like protein [Armadillidium vulgare]